jgi:hypothetical protein
MSVPNDPIAEMHLAASINLPDNLPIDCALQWHNFNALRLRLLAGTLDCGLPWRPDFP